MNLTLAAQALRLLADALEAPAAAENADLLGKLPAETPTPGDDKPEAPKRSRRTKAEMEADAKKEPAATAAPTSTTDTSSTTTDPVATDVSVPTEAELAQALTEKCKDFPRQQVTALLNGKRLSDHTPEERTALKAALDGMKKAEQEAW